MPTPSSVFTEMVTTTLRAVPEMTPADNVSGNNALYSRLKTKGKIKKQSGGYEIQVPLDYAENGTFQRFSGYDTFSVAGSDVLTSAKFNWCQSVVSITASGAELRMNSGKEAMTDLVKARITNAKRTASNKMSLDIYSDGALTNQIGGLAHLIQNAGTGTVGGIDSSTYTFWKNKFTEAAGTNTISKTTIKGEMMKTWLQLVRGNDKPDLGIASHDFYTMFWESLSDLQRYKPVDSNKGVAGFESLLFQDMPVIFDTNSNFGTTAEKMYFLNTNYLGLTEMAGAQWQVDEERKSVNQDAVVIPIFWMGQMTCSNRALQGALIDAA